MGPEIPFLESIIKFQLKQLKVTIQIESCEDYITPGIMNHDFNFLINLSTLMTSDNLCRLFRNNFDFKINRNCIKD